MERSRPSVNPPSNGPSDRNAWSVRPQRRRGRIFEKRAVQPIHNGCTTLFVCVGFRRDDPSGASEPRLASGLLFLRGSLYTVCAGTSFTISGPGRAHRATRLRRSWYAPTESTQYIRCCLNCFYRNDILTIGKMIGVSIVTREKDRCGYTGLFLCRFGEGGLTLRLATVCSSVKPFTNIVGNYTCHNGEKK